MEKTEEVPLYALIDEVLKDNYTDTDRFTKTLETLTNTLLNATGNARNSARAYILALRGAEVDELDCWSYIDYIDSIDSGQRPSVPKLKNAESRYLPLNLDAPKNKEVRLKEGLTELTELTTPRSGPTSLASVSFGGRDSDSTMKSLLEAIADSAEFNRILTSLALRSESHAFNASVRPRNQLNPAKLLANSLNRHKREVCLAAFKSLKPHKTAGCLTAMLFAQALERLVSLHMIAFKAFGFIALTKVGCHRDLGTYDCSLSASQFNYRYCADIFAREKRKQAACLKCVFFCKLTVEQLALWRWAIYVRDCKTRVKAILTGVRIAKLVAKKTCMYAAFKLWNSLLPLPSRISSIEESPDSRTAPSEGSTFRSSAYQMYLTRLNKLNILTTLVMSVRCSVEQLSLWKWKVAVTLQRRRQIIRVLKLCAKSVVKHRARSAFYHWKELTVKGAKALPNVVKKAVLRWHYVKKLAFVVISGASSHESKPPMKRLGSI